MSVLNTRRVLALAIAGTLATPLFAQDAQTMPANPAMTPGTQSMPASQPGMTPETSSTTAMPASSDRPTTPDGSKLFGFEPYFGVLGGYHSFDRKPGFAGPNGERFDGALIEGVLGANLPLGPLFVGVEGHGAKGFGDIDWEYGARGRAGARIGESGLIYGTAGYTWIESRGNRGFEDRKGWSYGMGVEIGPRDIGLSGITGQSGVRFRLSAETYDGKSIRPMGGVIFHF